jgi:hypothetical protein
VDIREYAGSYGPSTYLPQKDGEEVDWGPAKERRRREERT